MRAFAARAGAWIAKRIMSEGNWRPRFRTALPLPITDRINLTEYVINNRCKLTKRRSR